jgi:PAS domain S-box-containing protein
VSVDDILNLITQGTLILIAVLTFVDFLRYRDRRRFDISLMFAALASLLVLQAVTRLLNQPSMLLTRAISIILFVHPYLMLRLVQHFRPVPRWVYRYALLGMIGSALVLALFIPTIPGALTLFILTYFAAVEGYAAWAFVRGALATGGVTRNRLLLAGAASGLLALILVVAGVNVIFPSGNGLTGTIARLLAPMAVVSYYLGFVPPPALRRLWQSAELHGFLLMMTGRRIDDDISVMLARLCTAAARSVGGIASVAMLGDETNGGLTVWASTDTTRIRIGSPADPLAAQAWLERRPQLIELKSEARAQNGMARTLGAGAMFAVPILSAERVWGLLLVFLWRAPLFAADDLGLLTLFAQQKANSLSNANLLAEQRMLVGRLRQRSAQLQDEIAEHQRTEEALTSERDLMQALMDSIPLAIYIKDAASCYTRLNRWAAHLLGVKEAAEIIGKTDFDLLAADPAQTSRQEEQELVRTGQPMIDRVEYNPTPEGVPRWMLTTKVPIFGADGRVSGIVGVSRDITSRMQAEEELRKLNAGLANQTAQLESANQELEAFSYSVSHDLRSPLRAIDGYSRLLEEDFRAQLPPEALVYLERVRHNTNHMGELIDDLLAFSRMGRQAMRLKPVDMTGLVHHVLDDLLHAPRQAEIVVGELTTCIGDASLLSHVWLNLLSNALKFTNRQERPRIEVGMLALPPESDAAPGGSAYFVRDNGAGFDMQYAGKLFGVFQRLHGAKEFEGTGVGLAIAQRVIQRHQGRIWAEGELGRGATFFFTVGAFDERGESG